MAVRRLGDDATEKLVTRKLGRVLVTIDDLGALRDLITDLERRPGHDDPPRMGFKGGEFDEPSELVQLTDIELKEIWLKSPNVEIELGEMSAQAVGRLDVVDAIYNRWARKRQTRELSNFAKRSRRNVQKAGAVIAAFMLAGSLAALLGALSNTVAGALFIATVISVSIAISGDRIFVPSFAVSFAVIRSVTLNEHRAMQAESQKHWRTIAMSALAALIAVTGIAIGVILKK